MPIPTLITDLSTTASSNSPAGSDSPATLDDIQRAHASFIAQLRDGAAALPTATGASLVGYQPTGGTASTVQAKLRESVSVKDFGADDTGATESYTFVQLAVNALGGPGVLEFPNSGSSVYKLSGKITLPIGVSINLNGCTLDMSTAAGPVFSYNDSGASFSFVAPPTTINNGKIVGNAANLSAYPFKINRVPYVTFNEINFFTCNAVDVYGESILMAFNNVVSYAPIATTFKFQLGSGAFGPNGTSFNCCYLEEATNSGVVGIAVNAGSVIIRGSYLEAMQTHIEVNGGDITVYDTSFNLRKFDGTAAFIFNSVTAGSTALIEGCTFNFGEGVATQSMYGAIVNCALSLKMNNNAFSSIHNAASVSKVFALRNNISGSMVGNKFFCSGATGLQTIFDMGNASAAVSYLNFSGNTVRGEFGTSIKFVSDAPLGPVTQCTISANNFLRLKNLLKLNGGLITSNSFAGDAAVIQWEAGQGGTLTNNTFGTTPTVSNALRVSGNTGLEFGNTQSNRITTGSIAAGAYANVTVTWLRTWPGLTYSVSAVIFETTFGTQTLTVDHCCQITASSATFVVKNNSAGSLTGTLHATSTYDMN